MYPNFLSDRKYLGYEVLRDTSYGIKLVLIVDATVPRLLKPSKCKRQFVNKLSSKLNPKSKRVIVVLVSTLWFSNVQPAPAMGLSIPADPVVRLQPSYRHSSEVKTAPTVRTRLDKIVMMANNHNNHMIPLIYINGHYSYINEQLLKKLRAGDLTSNLSVIVIGVAVYLMFQLSGVDAFGIIAQWNAPTPNIGGGPPPVSPTAELSSSTNLPGQGRRSTALQAYGPSHTQASTFTNTDGSVNLDLGYREVLRRAGFSTDFECSFDRFIELASEDGKITTDTMRAAISALQLEADGVVSNVRRDPVAEANRVKAFDFIADGLNGETHLEIKGPVGSEIRKSAGLGPSIPKQGKKIGFKIRNQLNYWFNPNTDKSGVTQPEGRNKVLVVIDLFDVPSAEKAQIESSINLGLKGEHPILFINNQMNR